MYKINFYLKLFIVLLTLIVIAMTYNYVVLWTVLVALIILHYMLNSKKLLFIDYILIGLLFISYIFNPMLYFFKILLMVNVILSLFDSLSSKERKFFKILFKDIDKRNRKEIFYKQNYNNVLDTNKKLANDVYKVEIMNEDKIDNDLDRHYLQSKIRFNGYCDIEDKTVTFKWNKIDSMILIMSILLFILCIIFR